MRSPVSINTLKQHWIDTQSTLHQHLRQHLINILVKSLLIFDRSMLMIWVNQHLANYWPNSDWVSTTCWPGPVKGINQGYADGPSDEILHFDKQKILDCFSSIFNTFSVFLPSHRNTHKSLGELKKPVETLACVLCSQSISHSPKLPLVFL